MQRSPGWLYILSNPAMPGMVKVGMSTVSSARRAKEIDTSGVPLPFDIAFEIPVRDVRFYERLAHAELESLRVRAEREWFRCPPEYAVSAVQKALEVPLPLHQPASELQVDAREIGAYLWMPTGELVRCGLLELRADHEITFSYDESYAERPDAFPLDPLNLPLGRARYSTIDATRLGSIFDVGPDSWGRFVATGIMGRRCTPGEAFILALASGVDGIGALDFVFHPRQVLPGLSRLADVAEACRDLDVGRTVVDRALLAGSWTIGGARPKAILRDDRAGAAPDASVIAKFESRDAQADGRNRMEWATLRMARDMGMPVPQHELVDLGDHVALVLERFDRVPTASGMRRRHYVSAASFISAVPQSRYLDSPFDQAMFSWRRLMDVASAVGASASRSRIEVFGRLMLNAAVGNSDDHLKNFGFIKVDDDPMHYELAPVFDCSPQAARQHYLWCGSLGREYTMEQALGMARELKVAAKAAQEVRDRILSVLERRHDYFEAAGMSERQAHAADVWILRGTPELAETAAPLRPLRERA
jgi:serine/threonine-protein kinase HipA